jgi:hypothetical protein
MVSRETTCTCTNKKLREKEFLITIHICGSFKKFLDKTEYSDTVAGRLEPLMHNETCIYPIHSIIVQLPLD